MRDECVSSVGLPASNLCALAGELGTHELDNKTWDTGRGVGQTEVATEGLHECVCVPVNLESAVHVCICLHQ